MSIVEISINDAEQKTIAFPSFVDKLDVICYNCGKKFKIYLSDLKKKGSSRFYCSRKCYREVSIKKPKHNWKDNLTKARL